MSDKRGNICIVVGSGIAGLAAAIRASRLGWKVRIFEANSQAGGKIAEKNINGFRFDIGPSVLTKPEYLKELFDLCGKNMDDYISLEKVDPLFRFYFNDKTFINTFSDPGKMLKELQAKSTEPVSNLKKVLRDAHKIYKLTHKVFLERSLHKIKNYFNWPTVRGIVQFRKVRAFQTMHYYNRRNLSDDRLVRIFDRYASYNGSNPFEAPGTLNVISHFEMNEGAYFSKGGMRKIVEAMLKLAGECGVEINYGQRVDEIVIKDGSVKGVKAGNKFHESSCVICNTDIHVAYHQLMHGIKKNDFSLKQERSSSVIIFLWGLKENVSSINLHNTFFGEDDLLEYNAVFKEKTICNDPSIYLCNTSSHSTGDAPSGKANWFVMITAPCDEGQNWDTLIDRVRKQIIRKLSNTLNIDLENLIEVEEVISPRDIEAQTGSWKGSIYGNSSNGVFSAFLRHPNFIKGKQGLYFCGGSVHPGAGIPLCLLSAKIVAELIEKDFNLKGVIN
ncbi:MAG TPA: phytoene desaturase family protein [Bacteroidia bacterium]|nr:phytoene desaturase family protein [Bacteroidia bacterium]